MDQKDLRAQFESLDRAETKIREARKPYDEALFAIDEARQLLLDTHDAEIAGKCETCMGLIFVGDLAWTDGSGEVTCCAEHSPTWGEELAAAREMDADAWEEPDGKAQFIALAETKPADEKHVWPH